MNNTIKMIFSVSMIGLTGVAFAGADCSDEPKEKWMPRADIQAKILAYGYTIDRFKVDGNCYEIYGRNKEDRKVEVYFNPVTAEVVKEEIED